MAGTPTRLPHMDAAVFGLSWVDAIIAKELVDAGLQVVGIERGKYGNGC